METFELSRLTDFDFEAVCKDVFEEEFGARFEIFTSGADGGVDLRHTYPDGSSLIVQCKHWHRSTRAKLVEHVTKVESAKVARLNPARYVLATSLTLTKGSKDKLFAALQPYVKSPEDIYGKDEIDALLRKHEPVVRRHLRLWLTSASVLNSLLVKNIVTRSQALVRELEQTLLTYAVNPSYVRALEILETKRVCVIAGMPGIGKTTLAHILCAQYLSDGYELVEISEDTEEANRIWDDGVKQIYYYDDFLGQTTLDEKLGKNEDGRLLSLMKRVARDPSKRFILTTREYILAQAKQRYERLDRYSFDLQMNVIDLEDYTFQCRAYILYNHVYNSPLPMSVKASFASPEVYRPIIEHRNFNPRIVAATLAEAELLSDQPEHAPIDILANLENPHRLWDHIVTHQLSDTDVKLLKVVFSFLSAVRLKDLQDLWRLYGESLRDLKKTLSVLDGTMLKTSQRLGEIYVGFHNPSVRDYFVNLIQSDSAEVVSLMGLVRYYEQFETLWLQFPAPGNGPMLSTYKKYKSELEEAALTAFRAIPFDAHSRRGAPVIDFARRAWVYLEVGRDVGSSAIRGMGLEAVAENKERMNAVNGAVDYNALLQILAEDETPEGRNAFADAVTSAIEWALADVSDWALINEAERVLCNVKQYHPGREVEEALGKLEAVRSKYAQDAIDDWSQPHEGPVSSAAEMKEIIDYYRAFPDAPHFDGFETAEEAVYGIDWEHLSIISSRGSVQQNRSNWAVAQEVEHMMQTLRNVQSSHSETNG
ncbi:restriction endonuclease [Streptomyces sp. STCH 565 A]|uniref:nSTAND3 domain-containing NTPase n=1 Tax=Streptomyces sp. STCH 565 A TaxID=2950532 RepID=UPI0020761492|nr:restriction endonuclease [Streptomyces sp. STCH 565 A]MCM8551960.1 restriction endonuclease [Streptomyces sp. STCH 565 A]